MPRLGIAGSAWATFIAQAFTLIALIVHLYRIKHPMCLHAHELKFLKMEGAMIRTLITKGVPMGLQLIVLSLSGVLMITLVNRFGTDTTAAYGATLQIWQYVQMPAFAIGMAVSSMAAQNVGAQKWDRVRAIARSGVLFAALLDDYHRRAHRGVQRAGAGAVPAAWLGGAAPRPASEPDRRVVVHPVQRDDGAVRRGARDGRGVAAARRFSRWRC